MTHLISRKRQLSLSVMASIVMATSGSAYVDGEEFGMKTFKQGDYKHTYIAADSSLENLPKLIEKCQNEDRGNAIYMRVPLGQMGLCKLLDQAGFKYNANWYKNVEGTEDRQLLGQEWIIYNESKVPVVLPSGKAARGFLVAQDGFVLLVKSKKIGWTGVGGVFDEGETSPLTVKREVGEEVNLALDKEKLDLTAVIERTPLRDSLGLKSATDTLFYYTYSWPIPKEVTAIKLQTSELEAYKWFHWKEILDSPDIGQHVKLTVSAIIEGTINNPNFMTSPEQGNTLKLSHELPDLWTYNKIQRYREQGEKTWSPTLTISFSSRPAHQSFDKG